METRKRKRGDEDKNEGVRDCPTQWAWTFDMPSPVRQVICDYLSPAETSVIRTGIWADMPQETEFKQLQCRLADHFDQLLPSFPLAEFYRLGSALGTLVAGGSLFRLAHQLPLGHSDASDPHRALDVDPDGDISMAEPHHQADVDLFSPVSEFRSEAEMQFYKLMEPYAVGEDKVVHHYDDSDIRSVKSYQVGSHLFQWIRVKVEWEQSLWERICSTFDLDVCKLACVLTDKGPGTIHVWGRVACPAYLF